MSTKNKPGKINRIIYWVSTLWLALGMTATAIVQLMKNEKEVANITSIGFPVYFLALIGVWKILGVIALLVPKFPVLKEWVYAGFFFAMSGAIFAHMAVGHGMSELFGPSLLLVLTIVSWYCRPANRKPILFQQQIA
jgi:hypothetical protein